MGSAPGHSADIPMRQNAKVLICLDLGEQRTPGDKIIQRLRSPQELGYI